MIAKLKSFWYVVKTFFKTVVAPITGPALIAGIIIFIGIQQMKISNLKKEKAQIIRQYQDSLKTANKTCNLYYENFNALQINLNKLQEQTYEIIAEYYKLKSQNQILTVENKKLYKNLITLQKDLNYIINEIRKLKEKADNVRGGGSEKKH